MTGSLRVRRLLYVTPRFLPDVGGTEIHTYEVARRLARWGDTVAILTTDREGRLAPNEEIEGIELIRVRAWPERSDMYFAPALANVITRERWDLVHCQGYHTFVPPLAMGAALRGGIPYVLSFHSGGHSSYLRNVFRSVQACALRPLAVRAASLVAVSRFEALLFSRRLRLPDDRIRVIRNGAELTMPRRDVRVSGHLIISIGRLERYKGHQHAVRALPYVLATLPEARLVLVGSGPYEDALRSLERELGVADRVEHVTVPSQDRQAMAELIASASLVVLFSEYEAYSVAALEAASLGRPVLVFENSGMADAVEEGIAMGISPRASATEIATAIIATLRSPRPPAKVRVPTWDECASVLSDLYEDILTGAAESEDARGDGQPDDVQ
jgi:glycosyltransferase involved in cell wall biosynthesis